MLDDQLIVEQNVLIRDLSNVPEHFRRDFRLNGGNLFLYRPLTSIPLSLNYAFGADDPRGYHLFNVTLHASVSVLVFALMLSPACCP